MYAWLARLSLGIGARSADPRVVAFALTSTAARIPRTPRGLAAACELARDAAWQSRYVGALVLGEAWPTLADRAALVALANDEHALVRAALARGVAHAQAPASAFAALDPACVRIANHARIRDDWETRERA
ncbi:MAG: hypothetical protein NVSMB21_21990 [Vulcanimicrobiaceae bacterium]